MADRGSRRRLLVVDDQVTVCVLLARELRRAYDVEVATSAADALAHIRGGAEYALVLCDVIMAETSGMQFVDAVAAEAPQLLPRVALMTAGVLSANDTRRLAAVGVQLLFKPFGRRELQMIIEGLLARADASP